MLEYNIVMGDFFTFVRVLLRVGVDGKSDGSAILSRYGSVSLDVEVVVLLDHWVIYRLQHAIDSSS